MKAKFTIMIALCAAVAFFLAACQKPATNETAAVSNTTPGHSGNDMSNMQGHDMSNMNTMMSSPGAADQPYDLQFIDSMIHHHEGAVQISNMVIGKTSRPELKAFAQKIIDDQTKEIARMKQWREMWFAGKPNALNMELPGMIGGTRIMTSEHMKGMDEMEPEHFDDHFINMMIAHHEGAVTMAKDALSKAEHPEIKALGEQIVKAQEAEIRQMKAWKAKWMDEAEKKNKRGKQSE